MDSTEFNKIAGAGLGALLIFLLLNFFSGQIYGTGEFGHGGEQVLAFALPVEEVGETPEEEPQVDLLALVGTADPAAGESEFRACTACHALEDGVNKVGPHLYNVVGRDIAAVEGYSYSDALMAAEGAWSLEDLSGFLENPKAWAPGTKMAYAGIGDPQDRVNVIAYLNEVGGTPVDLAEGLEPVAAAGAESATDAATDVGAASAADAEEAPAVDMPGEGQATPAPGGSGGEATAGAAEPGPDATQADATGADAPTPPATASGGDEQRGETVLNSPDPSQDAPAQQNTADEVGLPGVGAAPQSGAPLPGGAAEAPPAPSSEDVPAGAEPPVTQTPVIRREGEQAEQGAVPQGPAQQPVEPQEGAAVTGVTPAQPGEADEADAPAQQLAAAPAEPAAPAEGAAAEQGGIDFASADVAAGENLFRRCAACHKVEEGRNGIGPSLWDVVGGPVAAVDGFNYSDAMAAYGGDWTPARLFAYLENPKGVVPGTKMAFAGLKSPQDRINVIAYMNEHGDSPQALQQ